MKKKVFGRKFKRDTNERNALFRNLISQLIIHERIETTEEKAKAIRSQAEKLVTKAKKHGENSVVHLQTTLAGDALRKMIGDVAPRFATRNGGYTRIIKTKKRISDNAPMAIIEWTEMASVTTVTVPKRPSAKKTKVNSEKIVAKKTATKAKSLAKKTEPKKKAVKKNDK